jgi:hypothetical protein
MPLFLHHFIQTCFNLTKEIQGELIALRTGTFSVSFRGSEASPIQAKNLGALESL